MKSLFFLYFVVLGVFGNNQVQISCGNAWAFSEEPPGFVRQQNLVCSSNYTEYTAVFIEISEQFTSANYYTWLSFISPSTLRNKSVFSGSFLGLGFMFYTTKIRLEPCGVPSFILPPHNINASFYQEAQFSTNLTDRFNATGQATIKFLETLIDYLPSRSIIETDNLILYRTVKMNSPYEENTLVVTITDPKGGEISRHVSRVILATGGHCINTYNSSASPTDWISMEVPAKISSYNITVPAKEIWYVGFLESSKSRKIIVDFKELPIPIPPSSPAYIPCVDFNIIFLLILSILIFHQ